MTILQKLFAPFLALRTAARRVLRRYRMRRAMIPLMQFDERMLRDIGLSRGDVIACLHFAEPEDLFEERARRQAAAAEQAGKPDTRLAA